MADNFVRKLSVLLVLLCSPADAKRRPIPHRPSAIEQSSRKLKPVHKFYIESFLHKYIPQTITCLYLRCMVPSVCLQIKFAAHFKLYSRALINKRTKWKPLHKIHPIQRLNFAHQRVYQSGLKLTDLCYIQGEEEHEPVPLLKSEKLITKASGQILFLFDFHHVGYRKEYSEYSCINNVWVFGLSTHVILNLTIHQISFQSHLTECTLVQLRIQMALGKKGVKDVIPHFNNWIRNSWELKEPMQSNSYIFCGQHSMFSIFPYFTNIDIRIISTRYVALKFHASFAVMDHAVVYSAETNDFSEPKPYAAYALKNNIFSLTYHLLVRKVNHIFIKKSKQVSFHSVIYDGPGFLSPSAAQMREYESVSSFQCLVRILARAVFKDMIGYFVFHSKPTKVYQTFRPSNISDVPVNLPDRHCVLVVCVVLLQAKTGYRVNVTLTQMTYDGEKSLTCKYGGLLGAEDCCEIYSESVTVCKNHDSTVELSRSFYSQNASFKLVHFWYPPYSRIHVSLVASATECKAVQVDICTLYYLCDPKHLYNQWNSPECVSYLKGVSKSSALHLKGSKNNNWLAVSGKQDSCYVLQEVQTNIIKHFPGRNSPREKEETAVCHFNLLPDMNSDDHFRTRLFLKGVLQRNILPLKIPSFNSSEVTVESVHVQGKSKELCVFTTRHKKRLCRKGIASVLLTSYQGSKQKRLVRGKISVVHQKEFVITGKLLSQSTLSPVSLKLATVFSVNSDSWVDIVVYNSSIKEDGSKPKFLDYPTLIIPSLVKEGYDIIEHSPFPHQTLHVRYNLPGVSRKYHSHVIMLQLSNKYKQKDIKVTFHTMACYFFDVYSEKFNWKSEVTLSNILSNKFISLAGSFPNFKLFPTSTIDQRKRNLLEALWIDDNFQISSNSSEEFERTGWTRRKFGLCYLRIGGQKIPMTCSLIPLEPFGEETQPRSYWLFTKHTTRLDVLRFYLGSSDLENITIFSWKEAFKICKFRKGTLPTFTKRNELDEVMSLMKLREEAKYVEGIFIGIHAAAEKQVARHASFSDNCSLWCQHSASWIRLKPTDLKQEI